MKDFIKNNPMKDKKNVRKMVETRKRNNSYKGINLGEKNANWSGNKISYKGLHIWVHRHKPKSMFCEKCGKITDKLDAANISGLYKRDISDFRWLCKPCHYKRENKKCII